MSTQLARFTIKLASAWVSPSTVALAATSVWQDRFVPAEDGFDLYFPDYDSLLRYCKKKFKRWTTGNPPPA